MRERNRLGSELVSLGLTVEREFSEFELEGKAKRPVRKIILVAGVEYPRYCKKPVPPGVKGCKVPEHLKTKKRTLWVLAGNRTTPDRDKQGSHWRQKCLDLAKQKLKADPDLQVYLYDFDKAIQERIKLKSGKPVTERIPGRDFSPLVDEDFRWVNPVMKDGKVVDRLLRPISDTPLSVKDHTDRPSIRYCPLVSTISKGDVKESEWRETLEKKLMSKQLKWWELGLSILHVYKHIEFVGKNKPYTLHELHLFGHASSAHRPRSGTAFVNTDHLNRDKTKRDPLDLDARADLDFTSSTIDTKHFRMAFAKGAMSYVWGCNWHLPVFVMIRDAAKVLNGKPLKDSTVFKFRFNDEGKYKIHPLKELADISGCGTWNDKTTTLEMDGKCFRKLLTYLMENSYMQRLADASAHCVTGGLPGTSSDYDGKSEKGAPLLSHIPMGGLYGTKQDLRVVLNFFAKHLRVKFNRDGVHKDFGRGFALYCPQP